MFFVEATERRTKEMLALQEFSVNWFETMQLGSARTFWLLKSAGLGTPIFIMIMMQNEVVAQGIPQQQLIEALYWC